MHGHISDLRSYIKLQDILAENGYRVFSYSRRYAWPNEPIEDSERDDWNTHAKDMEAFIDALNLDRPVHLVGNGSGAYISLLCARARPDLVATLNLEEAPVVPMFFPNGFPPNIFGVLMFLLWYPFRFLSIMYYIFFVIARVIRIMQEGDHDDAIEVFTLSTLGGVYYGELNTQRRRQIEDNKAWTVSFFLHNAVLPKFTEQDAKTIGKRIPTLCMLGDHSQELGAWQATKRLKGVMPGAKLVRIKYASHLAHENQPKRVADAIMAWIERKRKKTN
jgi:non-heme chloroperoxidase